MEPANLKACKLCPRSCGVNRIRHEKGRCHVDAEIRIARAALHMWEEPCLSGTRGSGAVFFSGCSLGCIYCQNREIAAGKVGLVISKERLAEIFLELQEQGANNINLVTAGHYVPEVCAALRSAKDQGLHLPVVYNSSGYEKPGTLRLLEGLVDIYLPDLKYLDQELARKYSGAPDYPEAAMAAIEEMVRQQPEPEFCSVSSESVPIMQKGVIVRHLLLPGHVREARHVVEYLYQRYGDKIFISMMNQYTPMREDFEDPKLNRRVTEREYQRLLDFAIDLGVTNGFFQEGGTAEESFIPSFDYEGVLR